MANPRRGLPHYDAAEDFYNNFEKGVPIPLEPPPTEPDQPIPPSINAYLRAIGVLSADDTLNDANAKRNSWLKKIKPAANHPIMSERGINPYAIFCDTYKKCWKIEHTMDATGRSMALKKILNQTHTSSKEQRYVKESINRDEHPLAYMQASFDLGMCEVTEEIAGVALRGALEIAEKNRMELQLLQQGREKVREAMLLGRLPQSGLFDQPPAAD